MRNLAQGTTVLLYWQERRRPMKRMMALLIVAICGSAHAGDMTNAPVRVVIERFEPPAMPQVEKGRSHLEPADQRPDRRGEMSLVPLVYAIGTERVRSWKKKPRHGGAHAGADRETQTHEQ